MSSKGYNSGNLLIDLLEMLGVAYYKSPSNALNKVNSFFSIS